MLKHILKSQFLRQLLGAVGGTLIALVTYGAYHVASDVMHAFLDEKTEEESVDSAQVERDKKVVEIGMHARALLIEQ